jgi:hypothetical protein
MRYTFQESLPNHSWRVDPEGESFTVTEKATAKEGGTDKARRKLQKPLTGATWVCVKIEE